MWVITRQISGRKEWFSTDGTRNFFMFRGSYWEGIFDPKYYKLFTSAAEGYNYLESHVKPNYVDTADYAVEEVKNMPLHQMWCITKTPTKLVKAKDKISDMEIAEHKCYLCRNTSGANYWEKCFSGEFTRKYPDKNKAEEKAAQMRLHTLVGKFTIRVEEIK